MPEFRRLPIKVEAVQFLDRNFEELQAFAGSRPQSDHNPDVVVQNVNPIGSYLPDYLYMGSWGELWVAGQDRWVALNNSDWVVKLPGGRGLSRKPNADFHREYADLETFDFSADKPSPIPELDETAEDARMLGRVRMALLMTRPMSEVDAITDRLMHIVAMYRVSEEQRRGPIGIVADPLRYDEDTMVKVRDAIATGLAAGKYDDDDEQTVSDIISELQNAGILFRELDRS